jgi:hypothetical protein
MRNFICVAIMITIAIVLIASIVSFFASNASNDPDVFEEGRQSAVAGIPSTACPIRPQSFYYRAWMQGWQKGFLETKGQKCQ